jgi:hypothetical protein
MGWAERLVEHGEKRAIEWFDLPLHIGFAERERGIENQAPDRRRMVDRKTRGRAVMLALIAAPGAIGPAHRKLPRRDHSP